MVIKAKGIPFSHKTSFIWQRIFMAEAVTEDQEAAQVEAARVPAAETADFHNWKMIKTHIA
jgi:hypothetical protein